MKRGSWVAGVLLLILAVGVWAGAREFESDSAFFPRAVALSMIVLTFLMMIENRTVKDSIVFDWSANNYARTAKVFVLTCIYLALLTFVGFLILTPLCLLILMVVMERGNLKWKVFSAAITTACIYLVFQVFLDVPLPAWSL